MRRILIICILLSNSDAFSNEIESDYQGLNCSGLTEIFDSEIKVTKQAVLAKASSAIEDGKTKEAICYYLIAAKLNISEAKYLLYPFYMNGIILPKKPAFASALLKEAADNGYCLAQYDLAEIYLNSPLEHEIEMSKEYLCYSYKNGCLQAKDLMVKLNIFDNCECKMK